MTKSETILEKIKENEQKEIEGSMIKEITEIQKRIKEIKEGTEENVKENANKLKEAKDALSEILKDIDEDKYDMEDVYLEM